MYQLIHDQILQCMALFTVIECSDVGSPPGATWCTTSWRGINNIAIIVTIQFRNWLALILQKKMDVNFVQQNNNNYILWPKKKKQVQCVDDS